MQGRGGGGGGGGERDWLAGDKNVSGESTD